MTYEKKKEKKREKFKHKEEREKMKICERKRKDEAENLNGERKAVKSVQTKGRKMRYDKQFSHE
jgi:hypothetical protein